jgi:hypothetical protein
MKAFVLVVALVGLTAPLAACDTADSGPRANWIHEDRPGGSDFNRARYEALRRGVPEDQIRQFCKPESPSASVADQVRDRIERLVAVRTLNSLPARRSGSGMAGRPSGVL